MAVSKKKASKKKDREGLNGLGDHVLDRLYVMIDSRKGADPDTSYTARLFARGRQAVGPLSVLPHRHRDPVAEPRRQRHHARQTAQLRDGRVERRECHVARHDRGRKLIWRDRDEGRG